MVLVQVYPPMWFKHWKIRKEKPRNHYGLALTTFCSVSSANEEHTASGGNNNEQPRRNLQGILTFSTSLSLLQSKFRLQCKKDVTCPKVTSHCFLPRYLNFSALVFPLRNKLGLCWGKQHNALREIIQEKVRLDV